jgi:hypothetical protein
VFDIAGISYFSGEAPALPITTGCYTPFYWDRLDSAECGHPFQRSTAHAEKSQSLTPIWLDAIVHHWRAYAQHRLSHFDSSIYFLVSADARCRSAPEYAGCDERPPVRIENDFIRKNSL